MSKYKHTLSVFGSKYLIQKIFKSSRLMPNGCREWLKPTYSYPQVGVKVGTTKKPFSAHRVLWAAIKGDPGPFEVCHTCDNKSCVNIDHLYLGTIQRNMQDASKHGLLRKGREINTAKLTEADVLESRRMRQSGMSYNDIARRFKVYPTTVERACKGSTWSYLR